MIANANYWFIAKSKIASPQRCRGISVIELMVSVTISLVLMLGVSQIYLGSKQSYRVREDLSMMQETGRFALDRLTTALMMADHWGGADAASIAGSPSGITGGAGDCDAAWLTNTNEGIRGSDGAANISSVTGFASCVTASNYVPNSDVLVVRYADAQSVSDTDVDNDSNGLYIRTSTGESGVLFNGGSGAVAGSGIGGSSATGTNNYEYRAEAYYLRPCGVTTGGCNDEVPTLVRLVKRENPGSVETQSEPLVEGVEQVQYQYGVDTDTDGIAEQFVSATSVTDWDDVIAVRIDMLVRTLNRDDEYQDPTVTYTLAGGTADNGLVYAVPADDRSFRRKRFTKVIQVRNRIRF